MRGTTTWVHYCKFAANLQNTFLEEHLWGTVSVFYIICFSTSNKQHILLTSFYNLQARICRLSKNRFEGFLYFMIYFSNFSQVLAVIEAPILFLFRSLVKQMFVVIVEAVPYRCSSRKIVWSIHVVSVKRNKFINNGQMSWRCFYFILFSFD